MIKLSFSCLVLLALTSFGNGQDGTYRPWPRRDDLLGYWPLNGFYKARDVGGRGANGVLESLSSVNNQAGPFGDPSSSFKSTSTKGIMFVNGSNTNSLVSINSSFTVSFYVKVPATPLQTWCTALVQYFNSQGSRNTFQINICADAASNNYSYSLFDRSSSSARFSGKLTPNVWNFVSIAFNASTCSVSGYNQFGLAYLASNQPWLCNMLNQNSSINDAGFLLGSSYQWTWKSDIAVSCLSIYSTELTGTEIYQLRDSCRIVLDASQCGAPRLPGIPNAPYLPPVAARPGQFPFLASLRLGSNHICSGSIVGAYWILTAAKCFENSTILSQYSVMVGEYDSQFNETFQRTHELRNFILHPDFGKFKGMVFNDVALIELIEPIDFSNPYVNDICVPWYPEDMVFTTGSMYLAGWGPNGRSTLSSSSTVRYTALEGISQSNCSEWGPSAFEYENVFCARGSPNRTMPCHTDEGGAAFVSQGDHYPRITQVGIYSYRDKTCTADGKPAVFTEIRHVLDWVYSKITCIVPGSHYPIFCPEITPSDGDAPTVPPISNALDCEEIHSKFPAAQSGIYTIYPTGGTSSVNVYCEMDQFGGGWTVLQRRTDDSVDFYRDWNEYSVGFGDLAGNFWLGNDNIYKITNFQSQTLMVTVTYPGTLEFGYAYYSGFYIESETNKYRLRLTSFLCGNASDSLITTTYGAQYAHDGMYFSTKDRDNDGTGSTSTNCAVTSKGGWWYNNCHNSNLNGMYYSNGASGGNSMVWYSWKKTENSMKNSAMMLRRTRFFC